MTTGLSSIGSYGGLGSAGLYGSYYDPSMMAMMNGYGSYGMSNPMMLGGMGMMSGMYNPTFMSNYTEMMKNMYSAQNEIQKLQLQNQVDMHSAKEQAQVQNNIAHNKAFFETIMEDGYAKNAVREMYDAVHNSNMDAVATKYFELKQMIINKYNEYYKNSIGGQNDRENIDEYISTMYAEIGKGLNPNGEKPDLRRDIKTYGESPFEHGVNTAFMGNSGHNKLTAEECLNQIYGTPINDQGCKAQAEKWGKRTGRLKELGLYSTAGAVAGLGAWGLGRILPIKMVSNLFKGKAKILGWAGAAVAGVYDICWQLSRT